MSNQIWCFQPSLVAISLLCITYAYLSINRDYENRLTLQWRNNGRDGISNHQRLDCLLNCLLRHRAKKPSKLRVTGLCAWNSPGPVNSPHKRPETRKMSPFDDVFVFPIRAPLVGSNVPMIPACQAYKWMWAAVKLLLYWKKTLRMWIMQCMIELVFVIRYFHDSG